MPLVEPTPTASRRRVVRLAMSAILLTLVLGASSCANGADDPDATLQSAIQVDDPISMARAAVERLDLAAGTMIVVPTDNSILALDADTLANFAADGGIDELIEDLVVTSDFDIESPAASLKTTGGYDFDVSVEEGDVHIGKSTLQDTIDVDGVLLFVVDRLFGR